MTEKDNPFSILPREFAPGLASTVRKSRTVMSNSFASLMEQSTEQPDYITLFPVEPSGHAPLPDGTGQIINIGI